jgi:hypothetical protein
MTTSATAIMGLFATMLVVLGVESRHVMAWLANEQFRLLDADGFDCLEWGFEA